MAIASIRNGAAAASALFLIAGSALAQDDTTIVINGSGGALADIITEVYEKPFEQETGIKVRPTASTDHTAKLRAQMQAGNIEWDGSELNAEGYEIAVENGWLEPLDWEFLDPDGKIPDVAKAEYGVAAASFSTILAVRTDEVPEGKEMSSWADFWNVEEFPGPRALENSPMRNLEFALLADGVPKDEIYDVLGSPDGVDRAFAKLDEIKPHIATWWDAGAEPVQLLADEEVYFTSAWNGRVTVLAGEGVPVEIVWDGGSLNLSYFVIPKGADHVEEAHRYIKHTFLDAERNAEFTKAIPYPSFNPAIFEYLPEEMAPNLPSHPENLEAQFAFNSEWWAGRTDELRERWNVWLLE